MSVNTCPKCQAVVPENTKFCPECGCPLEAAPVAPEVPVAPVTDQKKLKKKKRLRNFVIFIAIVAAIIGISKISSAIKARIDWDEIVLGEMIPTPPVTKGEVITNTSDSLYMNITGITPKQYADYIDECAEEGYASEAESTSMFYEAFNAEGYNLRLSYYEGSEELSLHLEKPEEMSEIEWPDSTAAKKLPKPKSTVGKFSYEYDDHFYVEIADTSKADYADYVKKCSEKGFKVDYDKGDNYYYADNYEGWSLSLKYQGNNIMSIDIDAPDEDDEEETTKPSKTETTTEKQTEEATTKKQSSSSVSSDFKKTMDEYEKFMDKYIDFMNKYKENPSDLGLLADYAKMMSDYADYCDEIDNIDEDELSDADLAYMLEVTNRVNQKLIDELD